MPYLQYLRIWVVELTVTTMTGRGLCRKKREVVSWGSLNLDFFCAMLSSPLFKWRHFLPDVILLNVRWYCRYALSYRDLEEMMGA